MYNEISTYLDARIAEINNSISGTANGVISKETLEIIFVAPPGNVFVQRAFYTDYSFEYH